MHRSDLSQPTFALSRRQFLAASLTTAAVATTPVILKQTTSAVPVALCCLAPSADDVQALYTSLAQTVSARVTLFVTADQLAAHSAEFWQSWLDLGNGLEFRAQSRRVLAEITRWNAYIAPHTAQIVLAEQGGLWQGVTQAAAKTGLTVASWPAVATTLTLSEIVHEGAVLLDGSAELIQTLLMVQQANLSLVPLNQWLNRTPNRHEALIL